MNPSTDVISGSLVLGDADIWTLLVTIGDGFVTSNSAFLWRVSGVPELRPGKVSHIAAVGSPWTRSALTALHEKQQCV